MRRGNSPPPKGLQFLPETAAKLYAVNLMKDGRKGREESGDGEREEVNVSRINSGAVCDELCQRPADCVTTC